ncbi:MAG: hypothetical protein IT537_30290 [Hyphomicrobiales bacterium]|nr:hypothetical protein [Hyphomicrobiales bacterium]
MTAIDVNFAPDVDFAWPDGGLAYAISKGAAPHEIASFADSPERKAHLRSTVATRTKAAMQSGLGKKLVGTRPARLDVKIRHVFIASAVQRVVLAGTHSITADITLSDARTGEVLVSRPELLGMTGASSGMLGLVVDGVLRGEPVDLATKAVADAYGAWLVPN